MGSCENSLEVEVEVAHEPLLHQTAIELRQDVCLLKVFGSEQEQLPCLEDGFGWSSGNVGPSGAADRCLEVSQSDSADGVNSGDLLDGASVLDEEVGVACEGGNAGSLVPGQLSEDECGIVGGNLNGRQRGNDDFTVETLGSCAENVVLGCKNYGIVNSPEDCQQSLPEGASVDKGKVCENENSADLVTGRLSEDECGIVGGNLDKKQGGIDGFIEKIDGLHAEKAWSNNEDCGLVNSLEDCDQPQELMPASDSVEIYKELDPQKDEKSALVQGETEKKSANLAAMEIANWDQMGPSLGCEMSAELRPTNAFPGDEVEQDKQQGSNSSLERVLAVMGCSSSVVAGTNTDGHNKLQASLDHEAMPQLMSTADQLGDYVQQVDMPINSASEEEIMNEKRNILPVMEATICNQLVSHQGYDKSSESMLLTGSPENNVQQDGHKFDRPANSESDRVMESKSDLLTIEKAVVDNQMLAPLVDRTCIGLNACSIMPDCQQNDQMSKTESSDGTNNALAAKDSNSCTHKSPERAEMPKELSIACSLVSGCDKHKKNVNDANYDTVESVPTNILEKSDIGGCMEACASKGCQRTLENLAIADSCGNCHQRNKQRDDKSVNGAFVKSEPDVKEGSNVTAEIKVDIHGQEFSMEGDAYDSKECSPKVALTSPLSCQSFGVTGNCSPRELEEGYLGKACYSAMCSSSAADCSEQKISGGKDPVINDIPAKTGCPDIASSSSRRSSRTRKSSQKPHTKRAVRKCRNKYKAQDLLIFKTERRKRSCASKPACSSGWGLLGNITQFFEQTNERGLNKIQNHRPSRTQSKSRTGGSSQRSSVKSHTSTGGIRLKVKVGNEVIQKSLNIVIPEVIDRSASGCGGVSNLETKPYQGTSFEVSYVANSEEVKQGEEGSVEHLECFGNKLEARIHSDTSVSDFHEANKDSEGVLISQKSSGDAEGDYLVVPSHGDVKTLDAVTEKRYTDPGTSPDSEVINLVPEGQVNTKCQEDFPDTVLTSSKAFVVPGDVPVCKKGKKKGRVTDASDCFAKDGSLGIAISNKVKATKNRGSRQIKGDEILSSEVLTSSASTNTSSNSSSSKEFPEEQLPSSRETELIISREALPEYISTETNICSNLGLVFSLSEPQNSSSLLPSTKSNCRQRPRKSGGVSKGRSKVGEKAKSKREDGCRQRKNERKSGNKSKVKGKTECNDFIDKEEVDPEIGGGCIAEDVGNSNPNGSIASMGIVELNMASSDAVEQHLPAADNAWVRCDACHKWRRIPVALVDSIGQTNCEWICKDNMDKDFADCSIPQEKSNAEINAELGLSDVDEEGCELPPKNKGSECKRMTVSKEHEFTRISTNQFLHRSRKTQTIDEIMVCHCKLPLDGKSGCGDECLNRMLNIECVRGTCSCGDLCSNQQFQKRNYAKMKWDRCGKKGFGLRLEENISKGKFLIEYVGEVLDMHTYEARQKEYAFKGHKHFYFMTLNGSEVIDACAKGNLGRFINHSCDPNCRTEKWVVNGEICIGLFALRDIKKGEELTFDYNYVRVFGAAAKTCYCGSSQCRGYIGGDPTNTDVIDQVDSDEEFLEPVMFEVEEAGDRIKNKVSRTSSFDNVELQVTERISSDRNKMDNFTTAAGKMEAATEIEDSVHAFAPAISQMRSLLEMINPKEIIPSTAEQADDAAIESLPAVKQEISIEEIQRLETSSAHRKPKLATTEEKRVFVKSRFLIKTSRDTGAKKGKFTSNNSPNFNKVQMMANKSQVLSIKPKKIMDGTSNGRFEAVEGKLNELLDIDGGISKRKDAAKGYLKFLLHTAASGSSGNGEAIQSNRDLSMILDALLKTKSRVVLIDIINKNGLRMLHNMLKQYRGDFKKTPILRKLLKVVEYLAAREILTPEHIYGGPPCPGMESFKKSMLSLTEHNDKQVHQIARNFRDRWFPRYGRKYSYMDRDDGRTEFHRGSISNRVSAPQNHLHDQAAKPTEAVDGAIRPTVTTASAGSPVHEVSSSPCVGGGTRIRKRKSRWDQPAEEKPSPKSRLCDEQWIVSGLLQQSEYNTPPEVGKEVSDNADKGSREDIGCPHCVLNYGRLVEANCTDMGRQNMQCDVPPGFSSPFNPALVSPNASSTLTDLPQQNGSSMFPVGMVVGHPQRKFVSRLSVSYGIPLPIVQQFGSAQDGTVDSWEIAPGMPFLPFPPLPPLPYHKNETPSSSGLNPVAIDETAEVGQQYRQDPATCLPSEQNPSTSGADQPDMDIPGEICQKTLKRVWTSSQDLGRRYFRQQKWNKRPPPWLRQTNGWGHFGNYLKGGVCNSNDAGSVTNESRNSYCSQDSAL